MRIVFADMSTEGFGIEILSPILTSKGHTVCVVNRPINTKYNTLDISDHNTEMRQYVDMIIACDPDIVGFSAMTHNFQWLVTAASMLKKSLNVPVIFGGIHVSSVPDVVLSRFTQIDYLIRGEGEIALPLFCDYIAGHTTLENVPNLYYRENGIIKRTAMGGYVHNLDSLPMPDKRIYQEMNPNLETYLYVQTSRGCHLSCSFCGNNALQKIYPNEKQHVRRHSPDYVINLIKTYGKKGKFVCFVDDVFTLDKRWLSEFTQKYHDNVNLPYSMQTHADLLNKDIFDQLKHSNCYHIAIGVQTAGNEEYKKEVLKRNESNSAIIETVKLAKERNIHIGCDHIFGLPLDQEEYQVKSIKFYIDLAPSAINLNYYNYFPGTDMVLVAKQNGLITDEDILNINEGRYFKDLKSYGRLYYDKEAFKQSQQLVFFMNLMILFSPFFKGALKWIADNRMYRYFPYFPILNDALFLFNVLIKNRRKDMYRIIRIIMGYVANDALGKKIYRAERKP